MYRKLVVCITGGIASGKTQVANLFAEQGCRIIDADIVAREVVAVDTPGWQQLVKLFGADILDDSGDINRRQLRHIVFQDDSLRQQLNNITHPLIQKSIGQQVQAVNSGLLFLVIPLLTEENRYSVIDRVLAVDVNPELQLERLQRRDSVSATLAKQMMASQINRPQRIKLADDVICNNQDLPGLARQVKLMYSFYISLIVH